jgi:hypothetical protein
MLEDAALGDIVDDDEAVALLQPMKVPPPTARILRAFLPLPYR